MDQRKDFITAAVCFVIGLAAGGLVLAPFIAVGLAIVLGAGSYFVSRFRWYSQVLVCFAGLGAVCAGIAGVNMLTGGHSENFTAGAILVGVCLSVFIAIAVMIELVYRNRKTANRVKGSL